jgi:hypothetical protein
MIPGLERVLTSARTRSESQGDVGRGRTSHPYETRMDLPGGGQVVPPVDRGVVRRTCRGRRRTPALWRTGECALEPNGTSKAG